MNKVDHTIFDKAILNREFNLHNTNIPRLYDYRVRTSIEKLEELGLIKYFENGKITITSFGLEVNSNGGLDALEEKLAQDKFLKKEKELIEFEKTKIDYELAKKTLKEFPKTKKRAKNAYIISIILAILQILQWIVLLVFGD